MIGSKHFERTYSGSRKIWRVNAFCRYFFTVPKNQCCGSKNTGTLNLDPDPELWPNLDPDPHLCLYFILYLHAWIQYGSGSRPQHCLSELFCMIAWQCGGSGSMESVSFPWIRIRIKIIRIRIQLKPLKT